MTLNKKKLAEILINYSCAVKKGEYVFLNINGDIENFLNLLLEEIQKVGAFPIIKRTNAKQLEEEINSIDEEKALDLLIKDLPLIENSDVYISLLADRPIVISPANLSKLELYNKLYKRKIRDARLKHCRWIGLRMPNQQLAKDLGLSISDLEKYYYDVCCLDYAKLREDNLVLLDTIKHTEKIEIKALNTNLSLSKKGIDAQIMCGEKNLPDGEIYTAPNKYSVNGKIKFNANSQQRGQLFKDIDLHFENGRVVNATSNNTSKLNEILDIDDGARYIGEFAFGINPKIYNPTGVILFDEKIAGSIHCALGQCYADACNGNNSALHWDLVQLHKANYGGGEIYFDEDLVCKDGEWKILQKVKK